MYFLSLVIVSWSKLIDLCDNLSVLIDLCDNLSVLIDLCDSLSVLIDLCDNLSVLIDLCDSLSVLIHLSDSLSLYSPVRYFTQNSTKTVLKFLSVCAAPIDRKNTRSSAPTH